MPDTTVRYFVAYTGIRLPFKFVNEITGGDLNLRNTYFKACYDMDEKLLSCQKLVYGEVEFEHQYEYYSNGIIKQAEIREADVDEVRFLRYSEEGSPLP